MPAGDRTLTRLAELIRTHCAHRRSRWRRLNPGQQALLVADDKPYYSGEHHRHGVNVQFLADPAGRLVWASPALPGAVLDLTAAQQVDLIDALNVPAGEAVELLTELTRSAADLGAVVRARIGRQLAAIRRRARVRADEDGQGYTAFLAARAAEAERRFEATQTGRAEARAALEAIQRRAAAGRDEREQQTGGEWEWRPSPQAYEPEAAFLTGRDVEPGDAAAGRAWLVMASGDRRY